MHHLLTLVGTVNTDFHTCTLNTDSELLNSFWLSIATKVCRSRIWLAALLFVGTYCGAWHWFSSLISSRKKFQSSFSSISSSGYTFFDFSTRFLAVQGHSHSFSFHLHQPNNYPQLLIQCQLKHIFSIIFNTATDSFNTFFFCITTLNAVNLVPFHLTQNILFISQYNNVLL